MSPRTRTLLAATAFALMTAVVGARTIRNLNIPGSPHEERYGGQDFRDNFYYPSVAMLDGRNPYDARDYLARYPVDRPLPAYSPVSLAVHLPFALLPFQAAEAAYFLASALLLLVLTRLALDGAGVPVTAARVLGIGALLVLSRPGHQTLFLGQCTVLVVLGVAMALVLARRLPWLAGAGLALACLKPSYGLPLGLLMLFRGDTRAFFRGAGIAAVAGGAAAAGPVLAAGGPRAFLESVRGSMAIVANDASFNEPSSLIRIDIAGLVGRFTGRPPGVAGAILGTILLIGAGVILRSQAVRARDARRPDAPRPLSDGLACLAILLSVYHQSYDALLLALPVVALALADGAKAWPPETAWRRRFVLALLLVPGVNYLATHTLVERMGPAHLAWLLIATANGAAILLAFALSTEMAIRPAPGRSAP
jgi:hypothetical protein